VAGGGELALYSALCRVGIPAAMLLIAALVLVTLPLAWHLSGFLKDAKPGSFATEAASALGRGDPQGVKSF
jgi:hypothetical protein